MATNLAATDYCAADPLAIATRGCRHGKCLAGSSVAADGPAIALLPEAAQNLPKHVDKLRTKIPAGEAAASIRPVA